MRDITFGQYYPTNSVTHRLDPRTKLLLLLIYMVAVFFIDTFTGYGILLLFLIFAVFMSKLPPRLLLKSIRGIIFLICFTAVLNILFFKGTAEDVLVSFWRIQIYKEGLINAAKLALRLLFLVVGSSLLTLTTTPVNLTDGLESLMRPLRVIRFPVHELSIIMSIALTLIPSIMQETDKIISAQKARCADFDSRNLFKKAKSLLPVLIPLFVSSIRRADELAYAMDSRCYRGSKGRTKMKQLKLAMRDLYAMLILSSVFFALLVLKYNFFDFAWIVQLW